MSADDFLNTEEITWQEAEKILKEANPSLHKILQQINPTKKHTFIKATYSYGELIVKNGVLHLPIRGKILPITDTRVPQDLKNKISYRSIPLALVINNSPEIFIEDDTRNVPVRLLKPGELFGVFEILDKKEHESSSAVTNISSGARNTFMLPKITDAASHKRLANEFGLRSTVPKNLNDHAIIFAEIMSKPLFFGKWYCEILFFTEEWLKEEEENSGWIKFQRYLLKTAWHQSEYWRSQTTMGLLWKKLVLAISDRNLKPRPHLIDTTKHIIFITAGNIPAFSPTAGNELAVPAKTIQEIYINTYGLKSHSPIIMQPRHFSLKEPEHSVYYSLSFPTLIEQSVNPNRQVPTIMEDLRYLKILEELLDHALKDYQNPVGDIFNQITFGYFHPELDTQAKVLSSSDLPSLDKNFHIKNGEDTEKTFPYTSSFLRGCVRISANGKCK